MNITAILFDLDGVIADSEGWWTDIDIAMLAEFGVDYRGEHKQHVLGASFTISLGFYKDTYDLPHSLDYLLERRLEHAGRFYSRQIQPYPQAHDVLHAIRSRGLKLALATSSVATLVMPFLRLHALNRFFDAIVTGNEVKVGKPGPDIYLLAADRVHAEPAQCVVVEDALHGIRAGKAAGMPVVAIPDARFLDVDECCRAADYCLTGLVDLVPLIDGLNHDASVRSS